MTARKDMQRDALATIAVLAAAGAVLAGAMAAGWWP
jgi:hypothetical protein